MPGRRKSCTKAAPPVILAGMSMRGADLPTILCCAAGVARDHRDAPQRHLELLGSDLGERRHDALPELDLAGEYGDAAVGIDAQPGIKRAVGLQAAGEPRRVLPEHYFWNEAE